MALKIFKIYYLYILTIIIFFSFIISAYVAGPPSGSTNAPGENTCYGSPACHGGTPNTGLGFGDMTVMGGIPAGNFYMPDSTYMMMPYVVDTSKQKGGFMAVARLDNGDNAGTPIITMPMYTQVITSGGYDYVGQTTQGAVAPSMANMHDWMYNWQAPPAGSGNVTFYVAFIAGDGDSTASGDNIYTDSLVLFEDTTVGIGDRYNTWGFSIERIYPLPANDFVNINFRTNKSLELGVSVIDISGRIVIPETTILINSHDYSHRMNLQVLTPGAYFFEVKKGNKSILTRKIMKN